MFVCVFTVGGIGQPCPHENKKVCRILEAFLSFDKFPELTMLFFFQPLPGLPVKIK
jgi:hypothetical protein